jgi:hypothetical protein
MQHVARQAWVAATRFEKERDTAALDTVARAVEREKKAGKRPAVVFDLDGTLYENRTRSWRIIEEWLGTPGVPANVARAVRTLTPERLSYSLADAFAAAGLATHEQVVQAAITEAKAFWKERFFRSAYVPHDVAYPGAASYVQRLARAGAEIVYLTGRDEPGMGDGTRRVLARDGFPDGTLALKANADLPDIEHKRQAAATDWARRAIASFENEPLNIVLLHQLLPHAMHVYVHTVSSNEPAAPGDGLYYVGAWV